MGYSRSLKNLPKLVIPNSDIKRLGIEIKTYSRFLPDFINKVWVCNLHEIAMHTALARGWIPGRSSQNFQTSQLVFQTFLVCIGSDMKWQQRTLS